MDAGELGIERFHGISLLSLREHTERDFRMTEISRGFHFADSDENTLFQTDFFTENIPQFGTEELVDLIDA